MGWNTDGCRKQRQQDKKYRARRSLAEGGCLEKTIKIHFEVTLNYNAGVPQKWKYSLESQEACSMMLSRVTWMTKELKLPTQMK